MSEDDLTPRRYVRRMRNAGRHDELFHLQLDLAEKGFGKETDSMMQACLEEAVRVLRKKYGDKPPMTAARREYLKDGDIVKCDAIAPRHSRAKNKPKGPSACQLIRTLAAEGKDFDAVKAAVEAAGHQVALNTLRIQYRKGKGK